MQKKIGRGYQIRTDDLTVPNRARYQTAPSPDPYKIISQKVGRGDLT